VDTVQRFLVMLVCLVVLAGCAGNDHSGNPTTTPTPAKDTITHAAEPFSGSVDVGGRSLYLECDGSGSPTVILEAGLTGDHQTWEEVFPGISSSTRVCAYDRANIAPSESAKTPRTTQDMVTDLHALLRAAGEPSPYLLVGFSFGGLVSQLYASEYPDEVAGMVLVESNHPDEVKQFEAHLTPAQIAKDHQFADSNEEGVDVYASFKEVQKAEPLPDIPLVVVTAGRSEGWPPGWDPDVFDRLRAEQQADLANMVPNGQQVIARHSTHEVPLQQPLVVVKAIQTVLAHT
jgi:alpha/beta hydrolase fold